MSNEAKMTISKPKRKTYTSTAVKARYNAKTYTQIGVSVRKDLAAKFKEKCEKEGISQASILKKAIEDYVGETE